MWCILGVLHHTGDLKLALEKTIEFCKRDGYLVLALYRRTLLCPIWKKIKKFYKGTNNRNQNILEIIYMVFFLMGKILQGNNPKKFVTKYHNIRGMSFHYDVRDWLGGYPYESIKSNELIGYLESQGFVLEKSLLKNN